MYMVIFARNSGNTAVALSLTSASWSEFVLYLPLCYLAPVMSFICAATGWGIWYVDKEGNRISKAEHKKLYPGAFR